MSKPPSGLFHGTAGEREFLGDAEEVIAGRVAGLDLREHPLTRAQLSGKQQKELRAKVEKRTATKEEYKALRWQERLDKRRRAGVHSFWEQERERILSGQRATRNWSPAQIADIVNPKSKKAKHSGKTLVGHHTYSVVLYPHLANRGEVIYPATKLEHEQGWHGGSSKTSLPGRRIRKIREF